MSMMDHWPTNSDWNDRLVDHLRTDSFGNLITFVDTQRETETVFPKPIQSSTRSNALLGGKRKS